MKTIQLNEVDFGLHPGPIGIAHSGGADSAIMLYTLMKYAEGPIHVYTCSSKQKHRVAPHIALTVIGTLIDMFDRNDVYHHVFFTNEQTQKTLLEPLKNAIKTQELSVMYIATTAVPPVNEHYKFTSKAVFAALDHERNPDSKRELYSPDKKFYLPWWNQNKKFIASLYEYFEMADLLFPLTRSCESMTLLQGHCGECWWCEERKWAFGRL